MNKTPEIPQTLIDKRVAEIVGRSLEAGVAFVRNARSRKVSYVRLQELAENANHPWWTHLNELVPLSVTSNIESWKAFYRKFFNFTVDLTNVQVPERIEGFDRLIIIAKGLSINQVYETGKKNFSSWKWCDGDIESQMQDSERGMVETYTLWVRNEQEADKDLLGKSAEDIENPQDTETLLERLLHGFKYWSETREHLDRKTYTLCASSRCSDGFVP